MKRIFIEDPMNNPILVRLPGSIKPGILCGMIGTPDKAGPANSALKPSRMLCTQCLKFIRMIILCYGSRSSSAEDIDQREDIGMPRCRCPPSQKGDSSSPHPTTMRPVFRYRSQVFALRNTSRDRW